MGKLKFFRDPIHNYIEIPAEYCSDFIDTYLFQRLRAIEQTSMRCLYPAARHDRFVHSIGTYHIATKVFSVIEPQLRDKLRDYSADKELGKIKHTFLLAALLHDCAHSPFSHTGEKICKTFCPALVRSSFVSIFNNSQEIEADLKKGKSPAIHEMASAYVACRYYSNKLDNYGVDKEQLARMITGVLNAESKDFNYAIYNPIIKLLNGFVIDVDRLDYLLRDSWASGVSNASVDIERLIKGIILSEDTGEIEIDKSALSSLINAIKARDFIYQWILPHHKVAFCNHILRKSIFELIKRLSDGCSNHNETGEKLFSPQRLLSPETIHDEYIYMPTDGDLIYLIKKYCSDDACAKILLTRSNEYKPLWKSVAEFFTLFPVPNNKIPENVALCYKHLSNSIEKENPDAIVIKDTIKFTMPELLRVKISANTNDAINLTNLLSTVNPLPTHSFVYVKDGDSLSIQKLQGLFSEIKANLGL